MRDELLAIEQFDTLLEAQILIADWRSAYNEYRPHSALGMLTPAAFARQWRRSSHSGGPIIGVRSRHAWCVQPLAPLPRRWCRLHRPVTNALESHRPGPAGMLRP